MKRTIFSGKTLGVGLFVLVVLMTGCDNGGLISFAGGSGTQAAPWQIETPEQLAEVRNNLGGYYVLNADIDLVHYSNFEPIGAFVPASDAPEDEENPKPELAFTGVFDGRGYKISNVTISAPTGAAVGLFGCVAGDNGVVKNLVVENVTVTGAMLVSGVIGYAASGNPVENITLRGDNTITGGQMVGGIVGGGFGDIENCRAAADIILTGDSNSHGGVLAGGMEDGSIISCSAEGRITVGPGSMGGIGGLAACGLNAPEITDCTVDVTITVNSENCVMIGGLLGHAGVFTGTPTAIRGCTVRAGITVPASAERVGGLVGSGFYVPMYKDYYPVPAAFAISNSSTSGSISTSGGNDLVGTIAGYTYDNSTVATSSSTMTVNGSSGTALVGGSKSTADLATLK